MGRIKKIGSGWKDKETEVQEQRVRRMLCIAGKGIVIALIVLGVLAFLFVKNVI